MRTETEPVSETWCFVFSRIPDDGQVQEHSNSVDNLLYLKL
jgi:hypothetical protein